MVFDELNCGTTTLCKGKQYIVFKSQAGAPSASSGYPVALNYLKAWKRVVTDAICVAAGTIAHYTCATCNKLYSDAAGTIVITDITDANNPATGVHTDENSDKI